MQRREFITLFGGGAAAWPLAARAEQTALPVIGFLHSGAADQYVERLAVFRKGLGHMGLHSSRARTSRSNSAGQTRKSTGCRHWPPIWFSAR